MMNEIARMRYNLSDRQKRHIQNQALLPDLRDESYDLHLETRDEEETARKKASNEIEQRKRMEGARLVNELRNVRRSRSSRNTRSLRNT
jgi:hypothetical protein